MRFALFILFLAIIAWFAISNVFERIGGLVEKNIINKVKDTFK